VFNPVPKMLVVVSEEAKQKIEHIKIRKSRIDICVVRTWF
jgi:hypothetical protein